MMLFFRILSHFDKFSENYILIRGMTLLSFDDFKDFYQICVRNPYGLEKSTAIKPSNPFVIFYRMRFKRRTRKRLIRWNLNELRDLEFAALESFLLSKQSKFHSFQTKLRIITAVCYETRKILNARENKKSFNQKFTCFSLNDDRFEDVPDPKAVDAFHQVEINLLLESCCNSISKHNQNLFHAIQARLNHNLTSFDEFSNSNRFDKCVKNCLVAFS